jgi:hypothetical protein
MLYHITNIDCGEPLREEKFKLEAVIVCREYADFLAYTLPNNKQLFDKLVVVTSKEDKKTQKLCEFYHVQCVIDPMLSLPGMYKGDAISLGLTHLALDGWVLHLDADIWLPPQTRILLERACLDKTMIYGSDRFNVKGADAWARFLHAPKLQHENNAYIHLNNDFGVATRVMAHDTGWIPIGFFQLWHPGVSGVRTYPKNHSDAGRTDMLFAKQWPRGKRSLIPEIVCYHLETDDMGMGTNWRGRVTSEFKIQERPWQTLIKLFKKR